MPLPIAHGLLGAGLVAALRPRPVRGRRAIVALLFGALLANAADLDFLLVFALNSKAWHRGFTHSLAFALVVFLPLALSLGRRRVREAAVYTLAFASHGVLDFLTAREGGGVDLLWPFGERLRLGWWGLSEVPSRLPPSGVLKALVIEVLLFAPPLVAVILLRRAAAKRADSGAGAV